MKLQTVLLCNIIIASSFRKPFSRGKGRHEGGVVSWFIIDIFQSCCHPWLGQSLGDHHTRSTCIPAEWGLHDGSFGININHQVREIVPFCMQTIGVVDRINSDSNGTRKQRIMYAISSLPAFPNHGWSVLCRKRKHTYGDTSIWKCPSAIFFLGGVYFLQLHLLLRVLRRNGIAPEKIQRVIFFSDSSLPGLRNLYFYAWCFVYLVLLNVLLSFSSGAIS